MNNEHRKKCKNCKHYLVKGAICKQPVRATDLREWIDTCPLWGEK